MIDSGDVLSLLGVPSEKIALIDGFHLDEHRDKILVSLIEDKPSCPYCNSKLVNVHGYYKVNINNSIIKEQLMNVEIEMRR